MDLSIVIPVYNEEGNINVLYRELKSVLNSIKKEHEIIFIDDGSTDNSYNLLQSLHQKDKTTKIIKFRKNFGQTSALSAGFKLAKGDIVVPMDADLQNNPKDIPKLLEKLSQGYDVICGWRHKRKDPLSKKIPSKIAYIVRKILVKDKIHDAGCTLKALKKESLMDLELYGDAHRFIPTILNWKGFKIAEIKVDHRTRNYGQTKYTFKRILRGFFDLINLKFWMMYATKPLHFFGFIGIIFIIASFIFLIYNIIRYGLFLLTGPTLLLSALLFIVGVQFICFGLLGEMQIRTYFTKSNKTSYSIEKIVE